MEKKQNRCPWCNLRNDLYVRYHDSEWGVPCRDDQKLFELLLLEPFHAGLSWEIVLIKRENFRAAFDYFNPAVISGYGDEKIAELMSNPGLIRNRRKMEAAVKNAQAFLAIRKEWESFADYLWHFTDNRVVYEYDKTRSDLSDMVTEDFRRRGLKFYGTTTTYSLLQAVGILNSHVPDCYLFMRK